MRWFWQRRRQQKGAIATSAPTAAPGTVQRAPTSSGRLGQPREMSDERLLLARDYLQAIGGRVRVEDDDALSATLPDGSLVRYTTTLAKARLDDGAALLVEGSESLSHMLSDIAGHARLTALRLPALADPIALALDHCAALPKDCGRCLTQVAEAAELSRCETCPLRQDHLALRWKTQGPLTARIVGHEEAAGVELAYLVAARDRQGRRDEWIRLAFAANSMRDAPTLSESVLTSAEPDTLPGGSEATLANAQATARRALGAPLAAVGIFLRQRSLDEYRRRLDEVATTFDRLQRESPEAARAAKAGRSRELSALAEVYAVEVDAHLESACFITSPVAVVALHTQKGTGELLLQVDLGRGHVFSPECAHCGISMRAGYVCNAGHPICPQCAVACAKCGEWQCVACGETLLSACARCGQSLQQGRAPEDSEETAAAGVLTVRHLEALPPGMWLSAVEWLLSCQGVATESRRNTGEMVVVRGHREASAVAVVAHRPREIWPLDEVTVRQAAAHLTSERTASTRMILSVARASAMAQKVALELGIQLLDREALQGMLASLASAHDRERERQLDETQTRADAATATRQAMLDVVDALEHALAPPRRSRRAASQAPTPAAASRSLSHARTAIERASLAWETLLTDWGSAFGERPARNGSLIIHAERAAFEEMADRASHLQAALLEATSMLSISPARGEAGYTAWRQAILDECAARCEAWRWRIRSLDPAVWQDFDRASNAKAVAKAAEATNAAGHATARADKAQSQALRAG